MPREAATIDAVVLAIPFVVKTWLYGAASPVSRSMSSPRIVAASSSPVIYSPRKTNSSAACSLAKWTSS